jgi:two-component system cell cycle sensor histidine kinase/response regulator CckA
VLFDLLGGWLAMAVIVVEDEEQVRVLAESVLQAEGHATLSAATADQALALLKGPEPIELLFVDLTLQGNPEAGLDLARKAVEARPDLKVLYTSALGVTDGMIALFVENSAFLPKPYSVDQLTATLRLKFGLRRGQPKPDGQFDRAGK